MLPGKIRLLVCDLDGTLVDSSKGIQEALAQALAKVVPDKPIVDFTTLIGPPIRQMLSRAYGNSIDEFIEPIVSEYRRIYDFDQARVARVYPGVLDTLDRIVKMEIAVAIFTNKPERPTRLVMSELQMNFFVDIVSLDSKTPPFSSKGEMLRHILGKTAVSANSTLVVGDSPDDAFAALDCGCNFAGVSYGFGKWEDAIPKLAFPVLKSFVELVGMLEGFQASHQ